MTGGPYRIAADVSEPPEKIETLHLRRFPLAVQVFLVVWFPAAIVFAGQTTPTETLICQRSLGGGTSCYVQEQSFARVENLSVASNADMIETTEHSGHSTLIVRTRHDDPAPIRIQTERAEEVAHEVDVFLASSDAGHRAWPLRHGGGIVYVALTLVELAVVAFLAFAQRRIRVDANDDRGEVTVEERRLLRRPTTKTVDLRAVEGFVVLDLPDPSKTQAVIATMDTDEDRVLFDALPAEAAKGLSFLSGALERWAKRSGKVTNPRARIGPLNLASSGPGRAGAGAHAARASSGTEGAHSQHASGLPGDERARGLADEYEYEYEHEHEHDVAPGVRQ